MNNVSAVVDRYRWDAERAGEVEGERGRGGADRWVSKGFPQTKIAFSRPKYLTHPRSSSRVHPSFPVSDAIK